MSKYRYQIPSSKTVNCSEKAIFVNRGNSVCTTAVVLNLGVNFIFQRGKFIEPEIAANEQM